MTSLGLQGRRRDRHRPGDLHDSRRDRERAGRGIGQFNLGPRVFVDFADVPSTGLLGFGSRADPPVAGQGARRPHRRRWSARCAASCATSSPAPGRTARTRIRSGANFDRAENYLSLVGLIIVILGGIAVSSVTRVFILQKIRSIAVLKCVGARSREVIAIYILQVVALGLAGSLLGVCLARLAVGAIPLALGSSSSLLAEAHYGVTWSAALQGVGIGVLVSLLFSIVPLLHVRFIKPSLLLRDESIAGRATGPGWRPSPGWPSALVALTAWQAASLQNRPVVVCAGFAGLAFVLHLAGRALVAAIAPLANSRSFPLRHAVLHLSRPGNQTRVILLAVGLGAFFIVGIRSLQASLLDEFSVQVSERFAGHVPARHSEGRRPTACARSWPIRPTARPGAAPAGAARAGRRRRRAARSQRRRASRTVAASAARSAREYTVTTAIISRRTSGSSTARSGTDRRRSAEVSIEQGIRERLRHQRRRHDARSTFSAGSSTPASRASARWSGAIRATAASCSCSGPASLDEAPQTFIAPLKGPATVRRTGRGSSTTWWRSFRNVSVIDFFARFSTTVRDVTDKVTLAITVVGGLVLFSGGADSRRRGGDDEVPAGLRGGGVQDARRQHADDRADAAVRIQRARRAGRTGRVARRRSA